MKNFFVSIIILYFAQLIVPSYTHVEHYKKFNSLNYELFRNDKSIGYHKYIFEREGNSLTVKSVIDFKITKLGVDLYNYFAESAETYTDDIFNTFSSKTLQNKKNKYVKINSNERELIIDGSSYKGKASKNYIVGTWWNHEIVKAKAQISAISGRIIEQKVTFIGKEEVELYGKKYNALHFNFASSDPSLPNEKKLNTDIWYEENSFIWLKASFNKTGRWEYRLKNNN